MLRNINTYSHINSSPFEDGSMEGHIIKFISLKPRRIHRRQTPTNKIAGTKPPNY